MDISACFQPLPPSLGDIRDRLPAQTCGQRIHLHIDQFPAWRQADWVIIGGAEDQKDFSAANAVRKSFMELTLPHESFSLADLGNYDREGQEKPSLDSVLVFLLQAGKRILLLGGSPTVVLDQIRAAHQLKGPVNWVDVDARFDMRDSESQIGPATVTHYGLVQEEDKIFSYVNLGYQRPLTTTGERAALESLHHEAIRYGLLQEDIMSVEPPLRTADLLNVDMGAMRLADAPAAERAAPGGFSATEIFRLARYAGLAYQLNTLH
ncbi:MAG: arginase family protein, partial [Bacteroidota bacterium]